MLAVLAAGTATQGLLTHSLSCWPTGLLTGCGLQGEAAADQGCGDGECNTQQVLH